MSGGNAPDDRPPGVRLDKPEPEQPAAHGVNGDNGAGGDASFDYDAGFDDFGDLADPLTDVLPGERRRPLGYLYTPLNAKPDDRDRPSLSPRDGPSEARPAGPPDGAGEDEEEKILIDGRAVGGPRAADAAAEVEATRAEVEAAAAPQDPPADAAPRTEAPEPGAHPTVHPTVPGGLRALITALRTRRALVTQLVIGLLCGLLGFGAVVQVRLQAEDSTLRTARQSDLIRILDDLNDRSDRLENEMRDLNARREELQFGSDRSQAALQEAEQRRATLGILAGTVAARGPGITLNVPDPLRKIDAAVLLDTLQELRDAGAEAVQINDVRVVASTDFVDAGAGRVRVDGRLVSPPYVFKVIGDPDTRDPALRIPGGVFSVLDERGSTPTVETKQTVLINAVRPAQAPEHARPAQESGASRRSR